MLSDRYRRPRIVCIRSVHLRSVASFSDGNTNEIGGVLGAELGHDVGAVDLDGSRTDSEVLRGLLIRRGCNYLGKNLCLAQRQWLTARKFHSQIFTAVAVHSILRPSTDNLTNAFQNGSQRERLFDKIESAIFYRLDGRWNGRHARHYNDRGGVVVSMNVF